MAKQRIEIEVQDSGRRDDRSGSSDLQYAREYYGTEYRYFSERVGHFLSDAEKRLRFRTFVHMHAGIPSIETLRGWADQVVRNHGRPQASDLNVGEILMIIAFGILVVKLIELIAI